MYRLHIEGSKRRPGGSSPSSELSIQEQLQAITGSLPVTADEDLDTMSQVLHNRTTLLQGKLDRAAALEWMNESHLQLLTIFRTEVGPNLKLALEDETTRVDGYLEVMKRHIKAQCEISLAEGQGRSMFVNLRRELDTIMPAGGADILEEVDRKVKRVVESKKLVQATSPLIDFLETSAEGSDQIRTKVEGMVDAKRNEALLERKLTKAVHGRVITEDVKGMLASIKRLR